ncbi:TPA: hypothetical protein ACH3X1_003206 [Trebouxia sp. C0004]
MMQLALPQCITDSLQSACSVLSLAPVAVIAVVPLLAFQCGCANLPKPVLHVKRKSLACPTLHDSQSGYSASLGHGLGTSRPFIVYAQGDCALQVFSQAQLITLPLQGHNICDACCICTLAKAAR